MVQPAKSATSTPVDNKYYTVTYKENGETHKLKVEKGIQIFGNEAKDGVNGPFKTDFKASGQKDITLPDNISADELSMLKSFANADKKPELTAKDVEIMYQKEQQGILGGYVNARTPDGVKYENVVPSYNYKNTMSISVHDSNAKKTFGLTVTTPDAKNNAPAG